MTLQYRSLMQKHDQWGPWQDWHQKHDLRFNHKLARAYASEVREKPAFESSYFRCVQNVGLYCVDDIIWFDSEPDRTKWIRVKVEDVNE